MSTPKLFEGQTALVTGGGWNIGRATAFHLAALGARVAVAGRRIDRLTETVTRITESGGVAKSISADCSDGEQCARLISETEAEFGPIDLCCSFAGGGMVEQPLDQIPATAVASVVTDNLLTAALTTRAVLPGFRERNRGTLILAAGGGAFVPVLGSHLSIYAAAKAGVCRLADQMTAETWDTGIRIFAIDPGRVPDEDRRAAFEAHHAAQGEPHPESEGAVPPEAAAELVVALHDETSHPMRGRCVSVHDTWWRDAESRAAVEATIHAYRLRRADL
ncbi:MAG: SDR family oxidoreductase [Planctomycetota bacterium]